MMQKTVLVAFCAFLISAKHYFFGVDGFSPQVKSKSKLNSLYGMKRPILDQIASSLFKLENLRVEASSEVDSKGRVGEPMQWSESGSAANKFSKLIASNPIGYRFKQFVADIVAGEFDENKVADVVDAFIESNTIAMFSFTTCPFCRKAKDFLSENDIAYSSMELDQLDGNLGNEIRAVLGRKTKRTSVPSIFISGEHIGGCNDGPGLLTLAETGELFDMLAVESKKV
eukprot:CAMPEP_0178901944 /NCGR_PEP_ID=MMETSP0786-20121207/4324_1 /TAXON_ID=186022 /ORGANISM="Thalassionema frauenfeldii, Strain CCMP 1798" /LENGTH=227 /DNA_ID=CAMNT_0020573143 /DNA_START=61 /DNA_END=744 /DNA_ORIENTATION=+